MVERRKYRTMESINIQRRERLREQNADFERTLAALTALKAKAAAGETLVTHMDYADNVFVKASVEPRDVVYIWLGAHVMLEFSYDEAETFIREQLDGAKATIVRSFVFDCSPLPESQQSSPIPTFYSPQTLCRRRWTRTCTTCASRRR
jgi:Prefoldin subunit